MTPPFSAPADDSRALAALDQAGTLATAHARSGLPRLAVVVPIFRHSTLLSEAIEAVLTQHADFAIRLILVNDGCPHRETDDVCLDYARGYADQVVYLRKPNGGLSDARNYGIRYVLDHEPSVEAVYLLDADNRLRPHAMARAMAVLDADPALGWVYPNIDMFGTRSAHDYGGPYSRLIHSAMNICEAGSLINRKLFEAGVMFDTAFKQGFEDWEFFLSAGQAGFRGENLEDFGFLYRKRPESMLADSEREGAGIRASMQLKHKAFLQPRSLVELEQTEAPRYAIFLVDRNEVVLTTDPRIANEVISLAEYEYRLWAAYANPSRYGVPPILLVTTSGALAQLADIGMQSWACWRLESLVEQSGIATLCFDSTEEDRMAVGFTSVHDGKHLTANALMIRPRLLREVLFDNNAVWINTLSSWTPAPECRTVTISMPARKIDPMRQIGCEATFDFLSLVNKLRSSIWRAGAMRNLEWRQGDIGQRAESHMILRNRLDGAPAYPRVADGRTHIGLTIPLVEFGGVEKVALNFARELKAAGYGVHLFILMAEEAAISDEWTEVLDSLNFMAGTGFGTWGGGNKNYYGTELPGWTENGNHSIALGLLYWLDTVIDFHGGAMVATMGKLKKLGLRTVSSLHLSDMSPMQRPVGNTYLTMAYEHAFDVFAPCSLQLADWLHGMGVPQEKIVPVVNAPSFPISAADLQRSLAGRADRDPTAPLRVMFLGRLDPQKGLESLSEVVERSAGMNIDWRIIGKSVIAEHGRPLSTAIKRVLEPVLSTPEELIEAYAWADVMLLLSSYEGLPLTILEAMRQGVVVIATDVGAVTEVLHDGENGVVLPLQKASDGCLAALRLLGRDRDLLRRLSEQAATDMQTCGWDHTIGDLVATLNRMATRDEK